MLIFFKVASPIMSSTIVYALLTIVSFWGHAEFTFSIERKNSLQLKKFFLVSIIGIIVSNLIILLVVNILSLSPFIGVTVVTVSIPIINFFALKFWVFK
jgi:putative flippase GtrA